MLKREKIKEKPKRLQRIEMEITVDQSFYLCCQHPMPLFPAKPPLSLSLSLQRTKYKLNFYWLSVVYVWERWTQWYCSHRSSARSCYSCVYFFPSPLSLSRNDDGSFIRVLLLVAVSEFLSLAKEFWVRDFCGVFSVNKLVFYFILFRGVGDYKVGSWGF